MWLGLIAAFAVTLLCGSAQAQPRDSQRARAHFDAGTRAFEEGDYALAIHEFEAAYEITRHADLLFNIYSAAERAGRLEDAERALAQYLEVGRPGRQRRSLEARLSRLRIRIEEARAREAPVVSPGEEPAVPAEAIEEPVPAETAPTEPPAEAELAPDASAQAEPEPTGLDAGSRDTGGGGVHPAGIGMLVGAGALLVSFGVFAILSEIEDRSLATSCGRDAGAVCPRSRVEMLETFNLVADVSWIAAASVGLIGIVLVLALPAEQESGAAVAFAPWVSADGAGARVVGRW